MLHPWLLYIFHNCIYQVIGLLYLPELAKKHTTAHYVFSHKNFTVQDFI